MIAGSFEQRNPYKGSPPRPCVRLSLTANDGTILEVELLADTGNPCAIILGQEHLGTLKRGHAPDMHSNFGGLQGGWLHVSMADLGVDRYLVGYASDAVMKAAKASHPDFDGLAGLPFLRLLEYGGNEDSFWLRPGNS